MRRFCLNASLAAIVLGAASPAWAQESAAAPESEGGYADIVVTAQKRTESLQEVPAAVSVVSGEQLEQRGVINITSLQQLVPSLNFKDSATTLDSSVFLRGVGTINFSIAAEPSVGWITEL